MKQHDPGSKPGKCEYPSYISPSVRIPTRTRTGSATLASGLGIGAQTSDLSTQAEGGLFTIGIIGIRALPNIVRRLSRISLDVNLAIPCDSVRVPVLDGTARSCTVSNLAARVKQGRKNLQAPHPGPRGSPRAACPPVFSSWRTLAANPVAPGATSLGQAPGPTAATSAHNGAESLRIWPTTREFSATDS